LPLKLSFIFSVSLNRIFFTLPFPPSLTLVLSFCCSRPTLSLVPFSHSPHSHASPSTIFTLPHVSSFPFSRFSLHLFHPVSPCAVSLSSSLLLDSPFSSSYYSRPSLRYIASIHLSFLPSSSAFTSADRDRASRRCRRGWTRTDWWRLSSVRARVQGARGGEARVVGASIVTVLNERP
jgi:hypothetical protein